MSHPHLIATRWLHGVLASDGQLLAAAPGGVHDDVALDTPIYPLVRLRARSSRNVSVINGVVVVAVCVFDVTIVGATTSYVDIESAAARLRTLLHLQRGTVAGGQILSSIETAPIAYPELATGGVHFRHLGGSYELLAQLAGA